MTNGSDNEVVAELRNIRAALAWISVFLILLLIGVGLLVSGVAEVSITLSQ